MKMLDKLLMIMSLIFIVACTDSKPEPIDQDQNNEIEQPQEPTEKQSFPKIQDIGEFENTEFLPTLESPFENGKNQIYAASLLMCWDILRDSLGEVDEIESEILKRIDASDSYKNVLREGDYTVEAIILENLIRASAYFKKVLPFEKPLREWQDRLEFKGKKVASFGFYGSCSFSKISYYSSDQDFAIKIFPKDEEHEIVLIKSNKVSPENFAACLKFWNQQETSFKANRKESNDWKYYYNDNDQIQIPKLAFNIEKNYDKIIGTSFLGGTKSYSLTKVYQRTALVLNEEGAIVESEAEMEGVGSTGMKEEKRPQPKKLLFDSPFYLLLKRKDQANPYFMAYVADHELIRDWEAEKGEYPSF